MDVSEKQKILSDFYFNPRNAGAFGGPGKLFESVNKQHPNVFTKHFVSEWLNDQDAYALQKQTRHRFKTANVRVTHLGEQLDIDLLSMANLKQHNDGVQFLLCAIDILSRRLWVKPLINKTGPSVLKAMKDILKEAEPLKIQKIRSDRGAEFVNKSFLCHLP